MKKFGLYLLGAIILLSLAASCKRGGARIIPKNKMADLYAEMFLADQWADTKNEYRLQADKTAFYIPILDKYGYTVEDYKASISHYMEDPLEFSNILKKAAVQLNNKAKALDAVTDEGSTDNTSAGYHPYELD